MFTVCPKCALTLVVTAADLRVAQGYVRCGRCSSVFNALARLTDDRQAAESIREAQQPSATGGESPRAAEAAIPSENAEQREDSPQPSEKVAAKREEDPIPESALEFDPATTDVTSVFIAPPPDPAWSAATGTFKAMVAGTHPSEAGDTPAESSPATSSSAESSPAESKSAESASAESSPAAGSSSDTSVAPSSSSSDRTDAQGSSSFDSSDAPSSSSSDSTDGPSSSTSDRSTAASTRAERRTTESNPAQSDWAQQASAESSSAEASSAQSISAEDSSAHDRSADTFRRDAAAARKPGQPSVGITNWNPPPAIFSESALGAKRPRTPVHTGVWGTAAGFAALVLLAQIVHHNRDALAVRPGLDRPISALYAALGMPLVPRWDVGAYEVRQFGAVADPRGAGLLTVRASIKNAGLRAQPLPLLRVTLQDRFGNRIAARDVTPRSYLPPTVTASSFLAAGQRIDAEVGLVDPGANAVGFEIDACLPQRTGIACANESATR